MFIGNDAITRTLVGVGLKSVGAIARIGDIPPEYPELQKKGILREATVIGIVAAASLVLEFAFRFINPAIRKKTLVQFVPQALAYCFAEWYSRKTSDYKEVLRQTLSAPGQIGNNISMNTATPFQTMQTDQFMTRQQPLAVISRQPGYHSMAEVYQPAFRAGSPLPYNQARHYYA